MRTYSASAARAELPAILDFVADGEEITITRHGRPVAVVLNPASLRSRRATEVVRRATEIQSALAEARQRPRPAEEGLTERRADELVAAIRADRSRP